MTTATLEPEVAHKTVADLVERLGGIPLNRILLVPHPGTATDQDLIEHQERSGRLCELVDGTLVEKPVGYYESRLGFILGHFIESYLDDNPIALGIGADALVRTVGRQIREPDISVYLWSRFPGRVLPPGNILALSPDLSVEILSESNTPAEMRRKRQEYFAGPAQMVWEIDPRRRIARVYRSVDEFTELDETQSLDGGNVLPGLTLSLQRLFERAGQHG